MAMFIIKRNTMTTPIRCKKLWNLCKEIMRANVQGDFIECGVWRGGSAGIMAQAILKHDPSGTRTLHLFDSFEGLPEPTEEDGLMAAEYSIGANSGCKAGIDIVRELLLKKIGFPERQIKFHQGWFQETIPVAWSDPAQIAVLRLDGDWYDSTKICFEHLYDRVSSGGVILLDDYFCWEGCRKATDEFRAAKGVEDPIVRIDADSGYWIKGK
jgi:predicted O-methyltransferase YrrM